MGESTGLPDGAFVAALRDDEEDSMTEFSGSDDEN